MESEEWEALNNEEKKQVRPCIELHMFVVVDVAGYELELRVSYFKN